jgi:hypothetical protein
MTFTKIAALAVVVLSPLTLTGCGGGGSSTPPPETPKIAPDAPFGGLSNPYNPEPTKKKAK